MNRLFVLCAFLAVASARYVDQPRPVFGRSFIIGGSDAAIGDYPTQASLRYQGSHTCGCAILSTERVLTAAHCVDGRTDTSFSVYYGTANRLSGGTESQATNVVQHPDFNIFVGGSPDDIALVYASVTLNDGTAEALNLPSGSSTFAGDACTITGWGRTGASNILPADLQFVNTQVVSTAECNDQLPLGSDAVDRHICVYTSAENSGACNGDSGGPLHCTENGVQVVAGLTSWGISISGECRTEYPSVYTRVSSFLDWIAQN